MAIGQANISSSNTFMRCFPVQRHTLHFLCTSVHSPHVFLSHTHSALFIFCLPHWSHETRQKIVEKWHRSISWIPPLNEDRWVNIVWYVLPSSGYSCSLRLKKRSFVLRNVQMERSFFFNLTREESWHPFVLSSAPSRVKPLSAFLRLPFLKEEMN